MADTLPTLGARIRDARRRALLTQEQLASTLEVEAGAIQRWEAGRSEPRVSQLTALARACGVDVVALVGPR